MRVAPDHLPRRLEGGLPGAILLFGDEPLLIEESLQHVRDAAAAKGFTDRIPLSVESGFDWGRLAGSSQTLSLFSDRRLIELRLPTGKPGEAGTRAIAEYCDRQDDDVCLLVITGRLDARAKQAKWIKVLDGGGWVLEHRSPGPDQFQGWLRGRLRDKGLVVDQDTVGRMCHFLEGNLLAAAQEIDRIALFADSDGRVDADAVNRGLADHARFNIYAVTDACLNGAAPKALRILRVLRNEGTEPVLVNWAMAREVRALVRIQHGLRNGQQKGLLYKAHNVWSSRVPMVDAALARLGERELERLMQQTARCDKVVKGRESGEAWRELETAALMMCGVPNAAENDYAAKSTGVIHAAG